MLKLFSFLYFCIVGPSEGFLGEGNGAWYYTLSLAINLMLVWWLKPEIALLFTILAVIHFVTASLYGDYLSGSGYGHYLFRNLNVSTVLSYAYAGIHVILLAIAIIANFKWALITAAITVFADLISTESIYDEFADADNWIGIFGSIFNPIMLAAFVWIDFMLPIHLWARILILVVMLIIHPVVEYFDSQDETCNAFSVASQVIYQFVEKARKI